MVAVTLEMVREIKVLRARKMLTVPGLAAAAKMRQARLENLLGGHIRKLTDEEVALLEAALGGRIVVDGSVPDTVIVADNRANNGTLDAGLHLDMNFHLSGAMLDRWDQESRVEALRAYRALCEFRAAREVEVPPVVQLKSELDHLAHRLTEAKTPEQRLAISREMQELARRQRA